jgi:DNA-binding response OmpR family regulator
LPDDDYAQPTVLIVEDDLTLADEMAIALRHHGMRPLVASDWEQAIDQIAKAAVDIIVLDQRLGAVDAVPRLPRLRVLTQAPVLVLTANQVEADRILALEIGADDFLLKPISGRELVARVRAHMRRAATPAHGAASAPSARPRWRFSLSERLLARPDGTAVPLTSAEFDLLAQLIETPNQPVDRDTLTRRVFSRPWRSEERAIDNLVLHLRQKLGPGGDRSIVTIRNQGYAFTAFPAV